MKTECKNCLFAFEEIVPDPSENYTPGKPKKRVKTLCCHVTKPAHSGFPVVRTESFCALFTDRVTREQPLAHLLWGHTHHAHHAQNTTLPVENPNYRGL